jgi:succinoglycan biosynthesis protein ExoM
LCISVKLLAKASGRAIEDGMLDVSLAICVATFRRPEMLRRALASLAAQRFARCERPAVRAVVVDNDPIGRAGAAVVEEARGAFPFPLACAVEERAGISFARNRLVAEAGDVDYLAFLDDDEAACEEWADALLATALERRADAVLGPVEPVFDEAPPDWMRPAFLRRRHPTGTRVTSDDFRTSNVLVAARALVGIDGPFDPEFAMTGGEDSFLGMRLERAGAAFYWADDAIVREVFPAGRTNLPWILKRRFRAASTLTAIRLRLLGPGKAVPLVLLRTAGLAALAGARIAGSPAGGRRRLLAGVSDLAYAAGNLAGLAGVTYREYAAGRSDHAAPGEPPSHRSRA